MILKESVRKQLEKEKNIFLKRIDDNPHFSINERSFLITLVQEYYKTIRFK